MIPIDLSNKVALVTGAGQGLGRATAQRLHEAGAAVAINYFDDPEGVNRTRAAELKTELGDRAEIFAADVRSPQAVQAMVRAITQQWGGLDIVVNNAAVLRDRTVKKMTPLEWQTVIDTNLTGVFQVSQAAAEQMRDGGRIVNMASVAAVVGIFGQANYVAAKAGVIGLTKVLSKELARRAITVNAVAPGVVLTEMGLSIPEDNRKAMLTQVPLGRFAEPREVADVILFLSSGLASYITGQTIHVNGGWWG